MPFANIKTPQAALSKAQKEEIVHRVTAIFVDYFGEAERPHTIDMIEEVPDGVLRPRRQSVRHSRRLPRKRLARNKRTPFARSVVTFLASGGAAFVSGRALVADGGFTIA